MSAGLVTNCIVRNATIRDGSRFGAGIFMNGGTAVDCTIVRNECRQTTIVHSGGGLWQAGGTALNCIAWGNTVAAGTYGDYADGGSPGDITYSCAPELTGGAGNVTSDPRFVDVALGDYRLVAVESPCAHAGLNENWMGEALDLDGNARVQGRVDMGAYETVGGPGGTLLLVR